MFLNINYINKTYLPYRYKFLNKFLDISVNFIKEISNLYIALVSILHFIILVKDVNMNKKYEGLCARILRVTLLVRKIKNKTLTRCYINTSKNVIVTFKFNNANA